MRIGGDLFAVTTIIQASSCQAKALVTDVVEIGDNRRRKSTAPKPALPWLYSNLRASDQKYCDSDQHSFTKVRWSG